MATLAARALRNAEARGRLEAALTKISKRLDVPVPDAARRPHDADLIPILEIERFVEFAEGVDGALAAMAGDDVVPGGYETWTVAMLRAEIGKRGLETGGARSKAELAEVLEEHDTAPDAEDAPEEESEEDAGDADLEEEAGDADSEEDETRPQPPSFVWSTPPAQGEATARATGESSFGGDASRRGGKDRV